MKLIIDIPEEDYKGICHLKNEQLRMLPVEVAETLIRIANGIPLDDIKAEISEEICLTDNPYTKETKYTIEHLKLLEILDNIGKVERSE